MTSYAQTVAEHARLTILKVLARQPGYAANNSVLADALTAYGFRLSRDSVRAEIDWLTEQRLVTVEEAGRLIVVTVTHRGTEVADGTVTVTGVKRPSAH